MMDARINYVELPSANLEKSKAFYSSVFGWALTDFGPSYSSTLSLSVNIGLQGDASEATRAPLPVIEVADLETALAAVQRAGGTITHPIFSFPGGRRFHFRDPGGNELAIMQASTEHPA